MTDTTDEKGSQFDCGECDPGCGCLTPIELEPCSGGCDAMVEPNGSGIAWCGQINCAAWDAAYERADRAGHRV